MSCSFCQDKKRKHSSPDEKCPRCGKLYDESGYLKTDEPHQHWYGMRPGGKTRGNTNPNRKENKK